MPCWRIERAISGFATPNIDLIRVNADRSSVDYQDHAYNKDEHYSTSPSSFYIDKYNTIGLVYDNKQPIYWNPNNQALQKIKIWDPQRADNSLVITTVEASQDGGYWLMADNAIAKYQPRRNKTTFYYPSSNASFDKLNSIKEDENGQLWISSGQGLLRLNPKTGQIDSVFEGQTYSLAYQNGHHIWFKNESHVFSIDINSLHVIEHPISNVDPTSLSNIALSKHLGVWLASRNALYYLADDGVSFEKVNFSNKIFSNLNSKAIFIKNDLWLSGKGLSKVTISRDKGDIKLSSFRSFSPFNHESLSDISHDSKHHIWLKSVTGDKVFEYQDENNHISMFDKKKWIPRPNSIFKLDYYKR